MKKKLKQAKKKTYKDDDGRVIADMDFDYTPRLLWFPVRKLGRDDAKPKSQNQEELETPLTRKETFSLISSALLAGLAIGFVIMLIYALVILLLVFFWT